MSQSRGFHPKNQKIFFSQIISESSKTYRKSLLKFFWIFFEKNIHLGLRKISKFSRFSLDIANLDHHCSQTSNAMTKWLGTVVHLQVEKRLHNILLCICIREPSSEKMVPPVLQNKPKSRKISKKIEFFQQNGYNQKKWYLTKNPINRLALWPGRVCLYFSILTFDGVIY